MIGFVINPESGGGKTGRIWSWLELELRKKFGSQFCAVLTEHPLHAAELTRQLLTDGVDTIVAVGGDGTLNEVVNGFFQDGKPVWAEAILGVLSLGTGADFIRTLNWPKDIPAALERLAQSKTKMIDLGLVHFTGVTGESCERYFINIADFGIGGAVVDRVNRTTKRFGGRISFMWSIMATLFTFKNKVITFSLDDGVWHTEVLNNFIVGNGRYFGSGLNPTPSAELDDGLFDVVTFGDFGFFEAIRNMSKLRRGEHLSHPKIHSYRAKKIAAHSEDLVFLDMDGECVGRVPVTIEIKTAALRIMV